MPCLVFIVLVAVGQPPAPSVDMQPDSFLPVYRQALRVLANSNKPIRLEGTLREVRERSGTPEKLRDFTIRLEYLRQGELEKLRQKFEKPEGIERIFVVAHPSFTLYKPLGSTAYALDGFNKLDQQSLSLLKKRRDDVASASRTAGSIELLPLVEEKGFRPSRLTRVDADGESLIRMDFSYRPSDAKLSHVDGWLVLDPTLGWAIRSYKVSSKPNPTSPPSVVSSGNARYQKTEEGAILPQELHMETVFMMDTPVTERYDFYATRGSSQPIPTAEFDLSHYGLADVNRPIKRSTNSLAYWAFGVAAVAIAGSVVLRRLSRS